MRDAWTRGRLADFPDAILREPVSQARLETLLLVGGQRRNVPTLQFHLVDVPTGADQVVSPPVDVAIVAKSKRDLDPSASVPAQINGRPSPGAAGFEILPGHP